MCQDGDPLRRRGPDLACSACDLEFNPFRSIWTILCGFYSSFFLCTCDELLALVCVRLCQIFWKLLEALLVCFQDSKRTMIVCVSLFAKSWMGLDGYIYILLFGKEGDSKYLFIQINVSPPLRLKHELKRELTGPMTAERENLVHIRCRFVRTQRVGIR